MKRDRAALMELLLAQERTKPTPARARRSEEAEVIIRTPEEDEEPPRGECSRRDSWSPEEPTANPDTVSLETDLRERGAQGSPDPDPDPGPDAAPDLTVTTDAEPSLHPECEEISGAEIQTSETSSSRLVSQKSLDAPGPTSRPLGGSEALAEGRPPVDRSMRAKARCRTLPSQYRGPETGDSMARTSHSTIFTHLSQQVAPSRSQLTMLKESMRQSAQSELARSILRNRSRPPYQNDLAQATPKPPSRPPSPSTCSWAHRNHGHRAVVRESWRQPRQKPRRGRL